MMPSRKLVAGLFPLLIRDLHLYAGLFISPFVLVFAVSVPFLVHSRQLPKTVSHPAATRSISDLPLPVNLDQLSGRERIDALKPALARAGIHGEVGWIQHLTKQNRLVIPVTVPGKVTTVTIDLLRREASVQEQSTGLVSALVELHKSPGPHLVGMRLNSLWMRAWFWLADVTVYVVLFTGVSGVYLWYLVRSQRKTGTALLVFGAVSCFSLVYALVH